MQFHPLSRLQYLVIVVYSISIFFPCAVTIATTWMEVYWTVFLGGGRVVLVGGLMIADLQDQVVGIHNSRQSYSRDDDVQQARRI